MRSQLFEKITPSNIGDRCTVHPMYEWIQRRRWSRRDRSQSLENPLFEALLLEFGLWFCDSRPWGGFIRKIWVSRNRHIRGEYRRRHWNWNSWVSWGNEQNNVLREGILEIAWWELFKVPDFHNSRPKWESCYQEEWIWRVHRCWNPHRRL